MSLWQTHTCDKPITTKEVGKPTSQVKLLQNPKYSSKYNSIIEKQCTILHAVKSILYNDYYIKFLLCNFNVFKAFWSRTKKLQIFIQTLCSPKTHIYKKGFLNYYLIRYLYIAFLLTEKATTIIITAKVITDVQQYYSTYVNNL